jgi:hypothetical protein
MSENKRDGYQRSIAFWRRWASVPLDIAVALVLGEDPEIFTFNSDGFFYLKALAMDHAIAGNVSFKARNNCATWIEDPCVILPEFGAWAKSLGVTLPSGFPPNKPICEVESMSFLGTIERKRKGNHITKRQDRDPRTLEVVVDVRGEQVTVQDGKGEKETYTRTQITGKGKATWLLLVLFASRFGAVEKTGPEVEKLNYAKNRSNLGNVLKMALGLSESPFIVGDASGIKFKSILAENVGIDAMGRKARSLDDEATAFLAEHGEEMPPID